MPYSNNYNVEIKQPHHNDLSYVNWYKGMVIPNEFMKAFEINMKYQS